MFKRFVIFGAVWLPILFAGCSSSPAPVEYTLEMSEFAFSPDRLELQVGQEVTLHIVNKGALVHEFMVGQVSIQNADGQFTQYETDFFESVDPVVNGVGEVHDMGNGEHMGNMDMADNDDHDEEEMGEDPEHEEGMEHDHTMPDHGFMVSVPGDTSDSLTTIKFTVTKDMVGEWEMGCFLDGGSHYVAGMVGTITVSP